MPAITIQALAAVMMMAIQTGTSCGAMPMDFTEFVGRADDMFVCSGENIYPGEVEKMLERHPDIHQACVVPVPDEIRGQKPIAFVVPTPGATLEAQDVKTFALANAPAYQHPRHVEFVTELPLAGTNKVDRHALIQRAASVAG